MAEIASFPKECQEDAYTAVWNKFIQVNSERELNLSDKLRSQIEESLRQQNWAKAWDGFETARQECIHSMRDRVETFLSSDHYQRYKSEKRQNAGEEDSVDEETVEEDIEPSTRENETNSQRDEDGIHSLVCGYTRLKGTEVTVILPPSPFFKTKTNFYYQLTPAEQFARLYLKEGINNGKFVIGAEEATNVEVHWVIRGD